MNHLGFTTVFWTLLGLYVFYQWDNRKKKKKQTDITFSEKGRLFFWDVTERELFDIMEDLAVETYYNKDLKSTDITYEPAIHLDEKTHQSEN